MSETRGVFSLSRVFAKKRNNQWVSLDDVWIDGGPTPTPATGYFGGGSDASGDVSTMDKISYSTDTTANAPGAALVNARHNFNGTGNKSAGYFAAGNTTTGALSSVERISYSTDTTEVVPSANLTDPTQSKHRYGTGNETAGYWAGGGYPTNFSNTDKLTYSTETASEVPTAALSAARYGHAATGNQSIGYFAGGSANAGQPQSTTDKLTYSTDTTAFSPSSNLSLPNRYPTATSSSDAAYVIGGTTNALRSVIEKISYSNDTISTAAYNLPNPAYYYHAAVSSSSAGYTTRGVGYTSDVSKISFSDDTTSTLPSAANLTIPRYESGGVSPRSNVLPTTTISDPTRFSDGLTEYAYGGYISGGSPGGLSTFDKVIFSSEIIQLVPSAYHSFPVLNHAATSTQTEAYYSAGSPLGSRVEKLIYSTETLTPVPSANMVYDTSQEQAATNNETDGFYTGGAGGTTQISKLTFSTETVSDSPAKMAYGNYRGYAATGNLTSGYFAGGRLNYNNSSVLGWSDVRKLTYSTETMANIPVGMNYPRYSFDGTGDSTKGYFAGGYWSPGGSVTQVEKITYSNDTISISGYLSATRRYNASLSNPSKGFTSGAPGSSFDRIDFATDTMSVPTTLKTSDSARSSRSEAISSSGEGRTTNITRPDAVRIDTTTPTYLFAGTSYPTGTPPYNGYVYGTNPSLNRKTIEKLNFSTDTFSLVKNGLYLFDNEGVTGAAVGNSTDAYIAVYTQTNHYKLNYANESMGRVPGLTNTLYTNRTYVASTGNTTHGYFGGGSPGPYSNILKITYSTETLNSLTATFSLPIHGRSASGDLTKTYFGGGYSPSVGSTFTFVDKLVYSTDTVTEIPGAALSDTSTAAASTASSSATYFGGGSNPLKSTMDKLTYSTETTAAIPTAALSIGRYYHQATGNATAGYFAGSEPGYRSDVDKLVYSTDTTSLMTNNMSHGRSYGDATSAFDNNLPASAIVPTTGSVLV